ncbi:MAG TPA: hypothetical protein VN902_03010 [Candidatus Acidoferrales bacterium]|jgi:hypothetical protein|nr:hypothetical protein [Candidatus Acidoferrales bacterium]
MPNPTLDQVTRNKVLLENGNTSVPERMSRSDWDSDLFAEIASRPEFQMLLNGISETADRRG